VNLQKEAVKQDTFTPAAGVPWLTPLYDLGIAVLTREQVWREALIERISPAPDDVIVDVGCGTGSLLAKLGAREPRARYVGIDPDPTVLERARAKFERAGLTVDLRRGFARDVATLLTGDRVTKVACSLVLHQVPMTEKEAALHAMVAVLRQGGGVYIADYGEQRSWMMRALFRAVVQSLDGKVNTTPNARGVLPQLMMRAGLAQVLEHQVFRTATGSISVYTGERLVSAASVAPDRSAHGSRGES
jgi:ubiquinone/menaquinone biosynthesis C-methylase UbiE